jgi:putative acyl-CoA dehydrogenase
MPRLYREAPVNSIWEGSGNVICLDVLRTIRREPAALEALFSELDLARGGDRRLGRAIDRLKDEIRDGSSHELRARRITELLAVVLQAALVVRHAPAPVADAFCASRLDDDWGWSYGTLPPGVSFEDIIRLGQVS